MDSATKERRMKVKVDTCWGGKDEYQRLTLPDGSREIVREATWNRKAASKALDLLERVYLIPRKSVRFQVR